MVLSSRTIENHKKSSWQPFGDHEFFISCNVLHCESSFLQQKKCPDDPPGTGWQSVQKAVCFWVIAGIQNISQNYVGCNAQRFHNINENVQGRSIFAAFQQVDIVYAQIGLVGQILLTPVTFLEVSPNTVRDFVWLGCIRLPRQY